MKSSHRYTPGMKVLLLILLFLGQAHAEIIQVLHTNDLHTYLEGTNRGRGGYARLKTLLDEKRAEAKTNNMPSIYLDGGDFGEGSSFFAAEQGALSFKALDLLNPDAAVLGNHDHILGPTELASVLRRSNVKTTILSANLSGKEKNDLALIGDTKDITLGKLRVRVIGLSTPERHAQYTLKPKTKMEDPIKTALPLLAQAKKEKIDFVIALSHAGIDVDKKLAEKSTGLGLIVGGHDHLKFDAPRIANNVPIIQAGAHGAYLGELILDVDANGSAKVISYTLHEISSSIKEDPEMRALITTAKDARSEHFQRDWDEVIGESNVILSGRVEGRMKNNRSCWSSHIARMTRESTGADIGLQMDVFQSDEIPAGKVTFGNIIDNFVHFNDWNPKGWELTTLRVSGTELAILMKVLKSTNNEFSATVDGIEIRSDDGSFTRFRPTEHQKKKKYIAGKPLRPFQIYTLALPREIPRAFEKNIPILGKLLTRYQRQPKLYIWEELEKYIRRNSPISCE